MTFTAPTTSTLTKPAPGPRPGWVTAESLPTDLPAPARTHPAKYPLSDNRYLGRTGTVGRPGTTGAWAFGGVEHTLYAGREMLPAIAAARSLAGRNLGDYFVKGRTAHAVFQTRSGAYLISPGFEWTGNPENDTASPLGVGPETTEFHLRGRDLVAIVDRTHWVRP